MPTDHLVEDTPSSRGVFVDQRYDLQYNNLYREMDEVTYWPERTEEEQELSPGIGSEDSMALDLLLNEARGMSDMDLTEVVHYMRYLKIASYRNSGTVITNNGKKKYRTAGKYQGKGWMSDDFDMPVEDFKEYM